MLFTSPMTGADSPGCRPVYMYPSYARITSFDESHTKFASKYSLYLYREQGKDPIPDENNGYERLDGIPVLFIPGNAGSYRQARSIAAQSSNLYFDKKVHNSGARNFDFFTADFNEDFTAFHGRTMLDQAEFLNEAIHFILGLYSNTDNPPKSVIIVGHSMGGVVARVMLTLPNYTDGTVNTIITLASPHAAAPLTFDGDILKIYSAVDRFWFDGFHPTTSDISQTAHRRLHDVSLISITGGLTDTTLPADYTTLSFLVPPSNGFTVYSTGIPNVWTNVDHLAIVWCHQLRTQIAKAMLEIADFSSPSRTYSLERRMQVFRNNFLTGYEDYASQDLVPNIEQQQNLAMKLDLAQIKSFNINGDKKLRITKDNQNSKWNIFQLGNDAKLQLDVLSSLEPTEWESWLADEESNRPVILLCSNLGENNQELDLTDFTNDQTNEFVELKCIDTARDVHLVPRSMSDSKSLGESSFGGEKTPFYSLQYNDTILTRYDLVVVAQRNIATDSDFVIAELADQKSTIFELGKHMSTLFHSKADLSLSSNRPLSVNIKLPAAWSSLLSYKLKLNLPDKTEGKFASFIRQWIDEPYESKWHINVEKNNVITLRMHGISPFVPFKVKDDYGLNIQLWSDTNTKEEIPLDIELSVDLIDSFRLFVMRYRLSIVATCVSISLLAMLVQFQLYFRTGKFPNFIFVLSYLNTGWPLAMIISILIGLNPIVKLGWVQYLLNFIDPVVLSDANEVNLSLKQEFRLNSFYLGLEESSLWFIGIMLYFIGTFLVVATYYLLSAISVLGYALVNHLPKTTSPTKTRIVVTFLLIMMIPIYIPYQIVYIISCVIQAINVLKSVNNSQLFNYQISLLILMLWILPVNIPIVIVFVHNLSVNWKTPFSSHHNLLSIVPVLLLTERNGLLSRLPKKKDQFFFKWYMGYFIFYCLIYGSRHTYWLHHLFNLMSCLVLVLTFGDEEKKEEVSIT
ncbi:lipase/thioesterase [Scheffersomyces stipitis CBS 6054]|uniref:GPI inositol-deacylase n=1 Tax=Scheffersomyces stipitis (strain ATCC 58785 / CBS 6054 / NBRC 10063 / NRRL Y-11545) TaxID=322104 RepID=A3LXE5_PICST|nr:lipase/thioesterase [Scheffersomyces stipitis CBS 6054]ABN67442.2 lipase/thioesterase [Scheffersomyces stipitis CBS 6054]